MNSKCKKFIAQDILAGAFLLAVTVLMLWKCREGFGIHDEHYYPTFALRLIQGGAPIADDWHLAQLFGVLLYIPTKLFYIISGSMDGIALFYRYLFVGMMLISSTLLYVLMRKHGRSAVFASVLFYLHIPLTIMSLSYNSMGPVFVMCAGLLIASAEKFGRIRFIISGILFACAVLCNPVLLLVFAAYSVAVLIKRHGDNFRFTGKSWLFIFIGAACMAVLFFIFLFSRTTLSELIDNLPNLFTDPEYQIGSENSNPIFTPVRSLLGIFLVSPIFTVLGVLILAVTILDRGRLRRRSVYAVIAVTACAGYIVSILISSSLFTYLYCTLAIAILGFECYLLSRNREKNLFTFVYLFGIIYSLCLDITSDLGSIAACIGLGVSCVAAVIFIGNLISEMLADENPRPMPRRVVCLTLALTMLLQTALYLHIDTDIDSTAFEYQPQTGEKSSEPLNVTIEKGPAKGLKTTSHRAQIYNAALADLDIIKKNGDNRSPVFVPDIDAWVYTYLEMPMATFSSWFDGDRWMLYVGDVDRLMEYYALHPTLVPKYIYVPRFDKYFNINEARAKVMLKDFRYIFRYEIKEGAVGYILTVTGYTSV